ncbi:MAG: helix-turn-helix transcriptional regulator [Clostridiales bacterium]|nr:helix-turn-helix transcriptional regulator [Clostridiales bacterium]
MPRSKKPEFENVDFYQDIALNIAYYRRLAGYTQAVLAEKAQITQPYLGSLESIHNPRHCSLEVLFNIARALNVHPYQLLKPLSGD